MPEAMDYLQFVLAPQVVNGLSIGMAVVLMALGLTVIFGLLDVINMAHGEFYALGAFLGVTGLALGLPFWAMLALVPLLMLPVGWAVERWLVRRVFHHRERHVLTLLVTFGLALVLEDAYRLIWGVNTIKPESPIGGGIELAEVFIPGYRVFLIGFGALVLAATWAVVYRTRLGAMVRAAAFDPKMAASLGVRVGLVYSGAFAFGAALAGLSGVLLAPLYSVFPTMGRDFILLAFAVVIVGGMGSIPGAILAGLLLTQVQVLSSLIVSPVWSDPLVFGIMVLVLMVRPQGLFGKLGHA